MRPLADMVEELAELTEAHVTAATALDAPEVDRLAAARADLLFDLRVRLVSEAEMNDLERGRVRVATERLERAEHRLQRVVGNVLRVLNPPAEGPGVYGPQGQVDRR